MSSYSSCATSVIANTAEKHPADKESLKFPRPLYEAVRLWTDDELDRLIFALETDSLLTPSELMKFLPSKNATEIDSLLQLILRSREEEILPALAKQPPALSEGESSIDIFRNSVRFVVDEQFSPVKPIASALRELGDKEGDSRLPTPIVSRNQTKNSAKHEERPNFSQIYKFLASLFTPGKPLELKPCNAAVIFDTLLCLTTVVGRIMSQLRTDPQLSDTVRGLTVRVGDLLATLAIARNCMHIMRGWGDAKSKATLPAYRRSVKSSRPGILPCPAVTCVLQEADLPEGYIMNRQLLTTLQNTMAQSWQFPTSDDDTPMEVPRHSLENYILNPLGIPTSEVPTISLAVAWQKLLTLFYQQSISSMPRLRKEPEPPEILPNTNEPEGNSPAAGALASLSKRGAMKRRTYSRAANSYRPLGMQVTKEDIDAHISMSFILQDCAATFMPPKQRKKNASRR